MKKAYLNNFSSDYNRLNNEMLSKMCSLLNDNLKGKLVGANVYCQNHGNGMGYYGLHNDQFKIFEIENVVIDPITHCFTYITKSGESLNVYSFNEIINIGTMFEDLNSTQPEVCFRTLVNVEEKYGPFFKRFIIDRQYPYIKYRRDKKYKRHEQVCIKLKNISRFGNTIIISDDQDNRYNVLEPNNINIVTKTKEDPFGEENWDD